MKRVALLGVFIFCITGLIDADNFLPNLTEKCFRCLCYVTSNCNLAGGCTNDGYCGPFRISKVYWIDSGNVSLPGDETFRNFAYDDCVRDYDCSKRVIEAYMIKYGKDCNNDGVTDCFDYMLINGNGGNGCSLPLNRTKNGRRWLMRYKDCKLS